MDTQLMQTVLPIIAGGITSIIMKGIKTVYAKVGKLSSFVQQLFVAVIAYGVVQLSTVMSMPLATDPSKWSETTVTTIVTALLAMGMHSVAKGAKTKV